MRTFAELLTLYMERTGIGDAELARRIPVSRPTLIRWREGVTARPRHREDVLRCAELLRLTQSETDEFLQAAGFSPKTAPAPVDASPPDGLVEAPQPVWVEVPPEPPRRRRGVLVVGAVVALVVGTVAAFALAMSLRGGTDYPEAVDGESLIVIAPFVNYTGGQQGYNVLGRLQHEIDSEVNAAGLSGVRTVEWPEEIASEPNAEAAGRRSDAVIVIWGEYDSGRVMARFTMPRVRSTQLDRQVVDIASSPSELPATINADLTEQVRYVALLTLGQLYLEQGEFDLAKTVLIHASDQNPTDPAALANLRYLLGRSYLGGNLADFDEAVWLFTQVLAVRPRSVDALNSRALAYLERAFEDLEEAQDGNPDLAPAHVARGNAHVARGAEGDMEEALADYSRAIDLAPDSPTAYFNRGLVYSDLEELAASRSDLRRAQALSPINVIFNRILCWQTALSGSPQDALPHCERAIAHDPSDQSREARGLAYARTGRTERAIADLEAFLGWVDASPKDSCRDTYRASRADWVAKLRSGNDPFDPETLRQLRVRPVSPAAAQC